MLTYLRNHFHPLWHLRQLRWFSWLQKRIDFPVTKRDGKVRFSLLWLRDFGQWVSASRIEPRMHDCFARVAVRFQPEYFLDIGANIGTYSWQFANLLPDIPIWMFEPDAQNGSLISRTLARNQLTQITLHASAVSDHSGTAEFWVDDISGTTGTILRDEFSETYAPYRLSMRREISCIDLDSLRTPLEGRRVLIKIDVEGAENQVLAGARQLLTHIRPVIFMECFDWTRLAWVEELGYTAHRLDEAYNYLVYPRERQMEVEAEWLTTAE